MPIIECYDMLSTRFKASIINHVTLYINGFKGEWRNILAGVFQQHHLWCVCSVQWNKNQSSTRLDGKGNAFERSLGGLIGYFRKKGGILWFEIKLQYHQHMRIIAAFNFFVYSKFLIAMLSSVEIFINSWCFQINGEWPIIMPLDWIVLTIKTQFALLNLNDVAATIYRCKQFMIPIYKVHDI